MIPLEKILRLYTVRFEYRIMQQLVKFYRSSYVQLGKRTTAGERPCALVIVEFLYPNILESNNKIRNSLEFFLKTYLLSNVVLHGS